MSRQWRRHQWANSLQTALLILILLGISGLTGSLLLGEWGLWLALAGGLLVLFVEPVAAWRLTLFLYRARPIYPDEAPVLWRMAQILSERAKLSGTPVLYYIPSPVINAFAVGNRRHAAIALTDGLLSELTQRELAGVLAHEIAHIVHDDLRVMGLADYISRLTHLFAGAGQLMILISLPWLFLEGYTVHFNLFAILLLTFSPHLAVLAQLGLSRVREYDADLEAAALTRDPMGLAFALNRIEEASRSWLAILFPGWGNPEPSWLRSHPPTAERIKRLREQAEVYGFENSALRADLPLGYIVNAIKQAPGWRFGGLWR